MCRMLERKMKRKIEVELVEHSCVGMLLWETDIQVKILSVIISIFFYFKNRFITQKNRIIPYFHSIFLEVVFSIVYLKHTSEFF